MCQAIWHYETREKKADHMFKPDLILVAIVIAVAVAVAIVKKRQSNAALRFEDAMESRWQFAMSSCDFRTQSPLFGWDFWRFGSVNVEVASNCSEKRDVHGISTRNSGAGNGCANFMGAWHFWIVSAGKPPCP